MSKIGVKITAEIPFTLNEAEARALVGIFGYSADAFLKVFYERMGRNYVQPHEAGVRSLHECVRRQLSQPLAEIDSLRKRLSEVGLR